MLNNITIGQFFPGDSLLHRMDPRAKIIGTTIFCSGHILSEYAIGIWYCGSFYHWCYATI